MTHIGKIASLQVGTPLPYGTAGATNTMEQAWTTSFFRTPSPQPRWLYTTHLAGNAQADTKNHGTLNQAILLYAAAHYPIWQAELGLPELGPGGFGENCTVEKLSEQTACIGDIYALGEARIQVTSPRYPCWKIERRWQHPGLTARVMATGRTGWYCRVLQEGLIEPGMPITLVERPYADVTVALVNDFTHAHNDDAVLARTIAACPLLPAIWSKLVLRQL